MTTTKNETDHDKEAEKQKAAFEKDPEKATAEGQREYRERQAADFKAMGIKEDINSMVHPDGDDPVEARGSGKPGVPAGTEDYEKVQTKALKDADKSTKDSVKP